MAKKLSIILITSIVINLSNVMLAGGMQAGEFLVLCYHNIAMKADPDNSCEVSENTFIEQMEYLRTHGYHPVSLEDILSASEGKQDLPYNPILLTFDDAYTSYYEFVFPVLKKFGYPSVLAVVGSWIDHPPDDLSEPLMSWDQIREVARSDLVEIASHTYDLHKGTQYNPQGNVGPAVSVLAFDPDTGTYETENEYRAKIESDFIAQESLFKRKLGITSRAVVWPYGRFNHISVEVAQKAGCQFAFTLEEGVAHVEHLDTINRNLILNEPMQNFIKKVANLYKEKSLTRAVQVDLDLIYDPNSYEKTDKNLGKLIDRLVAMKVNVVFLQAFSDPDGTGNVKSVYFANRVLPVKADIFSHAVHQMIIRDMMVYAWMPTLSIVLPDRELNESLRVCEFDEGNIRASRSWYKRLTPFSSKVRDLVRTMYEDLAVHSQIHGVLFQDDAYLTDKEDYHPMAVSSYKDAFGEDMIPDGLDRDPKLGMNWARYKTEVLIDFTKALMEAVRKYRPKAKFVRNLYAPVLIDPQSEMWFAQNYELSLQAYDQVVIMAYTQMEEVRQPSVWLRELVDKAKRHPEGVEKTVFKVQAYGWSRKTWVEDEILLGEMRDILAEGGRHIAYYPDNFWLNKPTLERIKLAMSTKIYPFVPSTGFYPLIH
jgi:biofilm PGA synthesis lipoprotein PgaB